MEYKKKIIKVVDQFYVDCIEEFKEAELKIVNDSKFRSIFRKKNYPGNIELLKSCRKQAKALRFPTGDIPKEDQDSKELIRQTESAIRQFSKVCDAHIQMQMALQKKAEGSDMSYKEYKSVFNKVQEERVNLNRELSDLDLLYTDYIEDEDIDVYEFL